MLLGLNCDGDVSSSLPGHTMYHWWLFFFNSVATMQLARAIFSRTFFPGFYHGFFHPLEKNGEPCRETSPQTWVGILRESLCLLHHQLVSYGQKCVHE